MIPDLCSRTFTSAAVLLLCCLMQGCSARPEVSINPKFSKAFTNESVPVTCNADQPLSACQFRIQNSVLDLSLGPTSHAGTGHSYAGSGLERGHCGVDIRALPAGLSHPIDCRVRASQGGWVYDDMNVIFADDVPPLVFTSDPPGALVVLPGQDIHIVHRLRAPTKHVITNCGFLHGGRWTYFSKDSNRSATGESEYYGAGLEQGECGLTLFNASDKNNGRMLVQIRAKSPINGFAFPSTTIIVAKPPDAPVLTVNTASVPEGATLSATCTVRNSRPVANLTWYLGGDVIRRDGDDDSVISTVWVQREDQQTITQHLTRRLRLQDDGKALVCEAQHVAISGRGVVRAERNIRVTYKPAADPEVIPHAALRVGQAGALCVLTALSGNTSHFWIAGDVVLKQGEADTTGHIHASPVTTRDKKWTFPVLTISNVTLRDLSLDYRLVVFDSSKRAEYRLQFSRPKVNTDMPQCSPTYFILTCALGSLSLSLLVVLAVLLVARKLSRSAEVDVVSNYGSTVYDDVANIMHRPVVSQRRQLSSPPTSHIYDYPVISRNVR